MVKKISTPAADAASTSAPAAVALPTAGAVIALVKAPAYGGAKGMVAAVDVKAGALCAVPMDAGPAFFCAPCAAKMSASAPVAWPPLYTSNAGVVATPPTFGARGSFACLAVVPAADGGYRWGMVHVYNAHQQNTAGSNGTGAMVAAAGPIGARIVPMPEPSAALAARAKMLGVDHEGEAGR